MTKFYCDKCNEEIKSFDNGIENHGVKVFIEVDVFTDAGLMPSKSPYHLCKKDFEEIFK